MLRPSLAGTTPVLFPVLGHFLGRVLARVLAPLLAVALTLSIVSPMAGAPGTPSQHAPASTRGRVLSSDHGLTLTLIRAPRGDGLTGSVLRIVRDGRAADVALDGSRTGRRARDVASAHVLPGRRRAVLRVDPNHDASGVIVIDLDTAAVVDAVTGRDFVASPDGRFWAFEEHAPATLAQWPHTETVYAVYDAEAPAVANARPCPTADERCRGQVLYLPDRLTLCHEVATQRHGSCLTPNRLPQHRRRSPFIWLSSTELAFVDADHGRQTSALVLVTLRPGLPAVVRAVPLSRAHLIEDVEFPGVRAAWTVDDISRDDNPSRLWLHFRSRLPEAPLRRLGVRLM